MKTNQDAIETGARALLFRETMSDDGLSFDEMSRIAYDAMAPIIAAQAKAAAWDAVIARIDLGTPHMVDEKYVAGAVWVRNQITDVLKATIEGGRP